MRLRRETFSVSGISGALRRLAEVHLLPKSDPPIDDVGFTMSVEDARTLAVDLLAECAYLDPPHLGSATDKTPAPRLDDKPPTFRHVIAWVNDRRANCLDIARCRSGADRTGWIEDARYFAQILHFLDLYAGKMIDELMQEPHGDGCTRTRAFRDPNCPQCQVADQIAFVAQTGPVKE